MIQNNVALNEMFIAKDEQGYFYVYGNKGIELNMRKNSFRKMSTLKKELEKAYRLQLVYIYEDLEKVKNL